LFKKGKREKLRGLGIEATMESNSNCSGTLDTVLHLLSSGLFDLLENAPLTGMYDWEESPVAVLKNPADKPSPQSS
jgi:hypothetical protein